MITTKDILAMEITSSLKFYYKGGCWSPKLHRKETNRSCCTHFSMEPPSLFTIFQNSSCADVRKYSSLQAFRNDILYRLDDMPSVP